MKNMFLFLILGLVSLVSSDSFAKGVQIDIQCANSPCQAQKIESLRVVLKDETGRLITEKDLKIVHEKNFHFIGFDEGLTNYIHEHPVQNPDGSWQVDVLFKQPGIYKMYVDITSKQGTHITQYKEVAVTGAGTSNSPPQSLEPKNEGSDRGSILTLSETSNLRSGDMAMIPFTFSREDGSAPIITPYLGAQAHFVITNVDGTLFLHVHPMKMGNDWMIHTEFPEPGDYRVFVQFIDANILRTVELALRVQ